MKNLVVLTGAGMSAESGLRTFRDADGLWEEYPVMQVASADGFRADPALVHKFYNARRRQLINAQPNEGHRILAELEKEYNVYIITQNVDNLHERAGSSHVLHLHGELMKVRAMDNDDLTFTLTPDNLDTTPETIIEGHYVRPHIVFFQEAVPMIEPAIDIVEKADILLVIGTSLNVYPAAGLLSYRRPGVPVYYIDPNPAPVSEEVTVIRKGASEGLRAFAKVNH